MKKVGVEVIERLSQFFSRYGLDRALSKVWCTLLIYNEPLTQREISNITGYSIGMVSTSLRLLQDMGFVTIAGKKGREKLYKVIASPIDVLERCIKEITEYHISSTIRFLQNNINSFDKRIRRNIQYILLEFEKINSAMNSLVKIMKRLRDSSLNLDLETYRNEYQESLDRMYYF